MLKTIKILFLCFVVSNVYAAPSINQQIKQTEQQQKQIEQKLKVSEKEVAATQKDLVSAAGRVSELEVKKSGLQKKIDELESRRKKLEDNLKKNRANISDAAGTILFIANNPNFDSDNMREYVLTSSVLSAAASEFNAEIEVASEQLRELSDVMDKLKSEKTEMDKTAKKYSTRRSELDKLLRSRSAQNEKLKSQQYEINKKLKDLSERARNISELSGGVGATKMSDSSRFSRRKLNPPVRGRLVVGFGEKTASGLQSDGWRIRVSGDALVVAPADGVIKFADSFRGFGRVIIMSHKNGYNTVMTNMGDIAVLINQEVLAGEPIGRIDASKSEMYLEVRRGANAVNPSSMFNTP